MKYFIDTEFIEDGYKIRLLSIGIVAEDGREYYAVVKYPDLETIRAEASQWVVDHVFPHINEAYQKDRKLLRNRHFIAADILDFVGENTNPQFWGDFAAYDWVALCQLFGTMMELPVGWPMFCRDIQQAKYETKVRVFPETLAEGLRPHHALDDAKETKRRYEYLVENGLHP